MYYKNVHYYYLLNKITAILTIKEWPPPFLQEATQRISLRWRVLYFVCFLTDLDYVTGQTERPIKTCDGSFFVLTSINRFFSFLFVFFFISDLFFQRQIHLISAAIHRPGFHVNKHTDQQIRRSVWSGSATVRFFAASKSVIWRYYFCLYSLTLIVIFLRTDNSCPDASANLQVSSCVWFESVTARFSTNTFNKFPFV